MEKVKGSTPLYNLKLTFEPPVIGHLNLFREISEAWKLMEYLVQRDNREDAFTLRTHVRKDGLVLPDFEYGLHTFKGKVAFEENALLLKSSFRGEYEDRLWLELDRSNAEFKDRFQNRLQDTSPREDAPRYTLRGLYARMPCVYKKQDVVMDELKKRGHNLPALLIDISRQKEDKLLDVLERIYREKISDQQETE